MTYPVKERDFQKISKELRDEKSVLCPKEGNSTDALVPRVEARLVNATWVLRRLPDKEKGFQQMRGMLWPETMEEPGQYAAASMSVFEAKRRLRISAVEIDAMQPALDLLLLLPDVSDRQLIFWAAWHQEGDVQARVPWARVRRSMGSSLSRWTMKRHYEGALRWLASLIAMQS